MDIHTNISLKNYLTMKLGGDARFIATANTPEELSQLSRNAMSQGVKTTVLGGGSNTLVSDEGYPGLIILNRIKGIRIDEDTPSTTTISFGAGENWDDCVKYCVEKGLSGIEAMSAIPGTIGAAPVQNIGAYGQELSDTFVSLKAYDTKTSAFVTLTAEQCGFAYRHSIFRGEQSGRYMISEVTLQLYKAQPQPPFYEALQNYFDQQGTTFFTVQVVRDAVMAIRFEKLPDPVKLPNTGSFFKNAIIEDWQLEELLAQYPDMPHYELGEKKFKVPTGWLIEQTGVKGQLINGIRVHKKNCLVLINESATSYKDLEAAKEEITGKVRDMFRIRIEQEPLELT